MILFRWIGGDGERKRAREKREIDAVYAIARRNSRHAASLNPRPLYRACDLDNVTAAAAVVADADAEERNGERHSR